nr:hypothetical protein CFP56_11541 [Quercus suber]
MSAIRYVYWKQQNKNISRDRDVAKSICRPLQNLLPTQANTNIRIVQWKPKDVRRSSLRIRSASRAVFPPSPTLGGSRQLQPQCYGNAPDPALNSMEHSESSSVVLILLLVSDRKMLR